MAVFDTLNTISEFPLQSQKTTPIPSFFGHACLQYYYTWLTPPLPAPYHKDHLPSSQCLLIVGPPNESSPTPRKVCQWLSIPPPRLHHKDNFNHPNVSWLKTHQMDQVLHHGRYASDCPPPPAAPQRQLTVIPMSLDCRPTKWIKSYTTEGMPITHRKPTPISHRPSMHHLKQSSAIYTVCLRKSGAPKSMNIVLHIMYSK